MPREEVSWPPAFMAGDAHDLIGWKRWISKEDHLSNPTKSPSAATFMHKPLLTHYASNNRLLPDPAYAAGSSHLKGVPRHAWARYAGDPAAGYDPIIGYNSHWAKQRSKKPKPAPFSSFRSASTSNLNLAAAIQPLNIRPVERLPPRRLPTPPPATIYKVMSMEDLAPVLPDLPGRRKGVCDIGDSSQMASFMAAHTKG